MNEVWPQQEVFCDRVKRFAKENGHTTKRGAVQTDAVADLFNLSEGSLRQFLYFKRQRRPSHKTLVHIAGVLGCSVLEFLDDPGQAPPGLDPARWAGLTERERTLAAEMLADMTGQEMTAREKEELFSAHKDMVARLIRMRPPAAVASYKF